MIQRTKSVTVWSLGPFRACLEHPACGDRGFEMSFVLPRCALYFCTFSRQNGFRRILFRAARRLVEWDTEHGLQVGRV
jgi:hypothetical protein